MYVNITNSNSVPEEMLLPCSLLADAFINNMDLDSQTMVCSVVLRIGNILVNLLLTYLYSRKAINNLSEKAGLAVLVRNQLVQLVLKVTQQRL